MTSIPAQQNDSRVDRSTRRLQIDRNNQTAWEIRLTDPAQARRLTDDAYELAASGEPEAEPYRLGLAASLRCRAFLNNDVGNYSEALSESLQALELLENLGGADPAAEPVRVDLFGTLSWTFRNLGDYSGAADYGMKALRLAQEIGDHRRQARLYDILGNIYADSNDLETALNYGLTALQYYRQEGALTGECVALNNLALTYMQMGDGDKALAACLESQRIAIENNVNAVALTVLSTRGEIRLGLKDYPQAEADLKQALTWSRERGAKNDEFLNLLNLGKVYAGQRNDPAAIAAFEEALTLSQTLNDRAGEFQCHQLLAELYEKRGDFDPALRHFKQFHDLKETVFNTNAARRLAGLQMAHDLETARRDAELHRLLTVELKKEIEARRGAQAALAALADADSLTGLFNRRAFSELGEREVQRARPGGKPLAAILFDLDHFKQINDTFGHAAGDRALIRVSQVVRETLRQGDILGRYGGDEFVILLPGTTAAQSLQIAERLREKVAAQVVATPQGDLSVTLSLGVAELGDDPDAGLDRLLELADQALYSAKRAGRNRTAGASPQGTEAQAAAA